MHGGTDQRDTNQFHADNLKGKKLRNFAINTTQ